MEANLRHSRTLRKVSLIIIAVAAVVVAAFVLVDVDLRMEAGARPSIIKILRRLLCGAEHGGFRQK